MLHDHESVNLRLTLSYVIVILSGHAPPSEVFALGKSSLSDFNFC